MPLNDEGREIVNAAYEVRSTLGPGLLESTYEVCLAHELTVRGLEVRTQVPLPVVYNDVQLDAGCHLELVVAGTFDVEVNAVARCCQFARASYSH
jgi:GxxExxY protein